MRPETHATPNDRGAGTGARPPALAALALAAALATATPPAQAWEDFGSLFYHGQDETLVLWIQGRYKLSSGNYRWDAVVLGDDFGPSPGTVWQTGGSFTVNRLRLGNTNGAIGTYTLDAGLLSTGATGVATSNGWGTFTQNGGFHVVSGDLGIGGTSCCRGASQGTYTMAGGLATAGTLRVGASSTWEQLAGDASFGSGRVQGYGTLRLRGGLLMFSDTLEIERTAVGNNGSIHGQMSFEGGVMQGTLAVTGQLDAIGGELRGRLDVRSAGVAAVNGTFTVQQGIHNQGQLAISSTSRLTLAGAGLVNAAGGVLNQAGRVEGSAPWANHGQAALAGELRGSGAVDNTGTVLMERALLLERNGVLTNSGQWTVQATTLTLGTQARALNQGSWVLDRSRIDGSSGFTNDATGVLSSRGNSSVAGALDNRGLTRIEAGTLTAGGGVKNFGTLALTDGGSVLAGGSIGNDGLITGLGRIDNAIVQRGTVRAEGGTLALHGALDLRSGSRLEVAANSRLQVVATHLRVVGDVVLESGAGAPATLAVSGQLEHNGQLQGQGRIETTNTRLNGTMQFGAGASSIAGTVDHRRNARIGLDAGAQLRFEDAVTLRTGSELSLAAGATAAFDAALALESGARIVGEGQLQIGELLDIGAGIAELSFAGQVLFGAGSAYRAQIGATGADRLAAAAGIGFDGTLQLQLLSGFVPSAGATFALFDAGQFGGGFAQVDTAAASLPEGLAWDFSRLHSQGVVAVTTAVPEVPSPWLMLGGLLGVGLRGWRRQRAAAA